MKKRILIAVAAVCIAGGGVTLFANGGDTSGPPLKDYCRNIPSRNNGHCTTDGVHAFCEKAGWFDRIDCVMEGD